MKHEGLSYEPIVVHANVLKSLFAIVRQIAQRPEDECHLCNQVFCFLSTGRVCYWHKDTLFASVRFTVQNDQAKKYLAFNTSDTSNDPCSG